MWVGQAKACPKWRVRKKPPRQAAPATPPQEGNVPMQTLNSPMLVRPYRLRKFNGASGCV